MELTVIIPAYNERHTLGKILEVVARTLPGVSKEIIIVDDCFTDGTREWLLSNFPKEKWSGSGMTLDKDGKLALSSDARSAQITIHALYHECNKGKGGGLQTGLAAATGDVIVFQDADLEYDPPGLGGDVRSDRRAKGCRCGLWFALLWTTAPLTIFPSLHGKPINFVTVQYSLQSNPHRYRSVL